MSLQVRHESKISVVETLEGEFVSPGDNTVTVNQLSETFNLTAATTPPVTKHSAFEIPLVAGAVTIDLTSLPGLNGEAGAVNGTGLKVQSIRFRNKSTNANLITVTEGASNGYELAGNTWKLGLLPGQSTQMFGNDATPDIAAGAKTIDVTGTGAQILEVHVVMG
jgi:hypothetical protein